jgi:hypothetical protein
VTDVWGLATGIAAHGLELPRDPFIAEPLDDESWDQLLETVSQQRLIGLLVAAVGSGEVAISRAQQADLDRELHGSTIRTLLLEQSLIRFVALLDDAQIDYRVMKGAALAHLDYADPGLRPYIDVDLLVPSSSFDAAVSVFSAHGCTRLYPQPRPGFDRRFAKGTTFLTPSGHELDLHRTFVAGAYGVLVQAEDLFKTVTPFRIAGHELRALGAEERFLHACFHARLGDTPPRLLPLRDLVQLVLGQSLDLERIAARCVSWRAEAVVAEAVQLAWDCLGVRDVVPLSTWASARGTTKIEQRRLAAYNDVWNYPALVASEFRALPNIADQFAFLRALALPDREYLGGRYRGHVDRWRYGARRLLSRGSHAGAPSEVSVWRRD